MIQEKYMMLRLEYCGERKTVWEGVTHSKACVLNEMFL